MGKREGGKLGIFNVIRNGIRYQYSMKRQNKVKYRNKLAGLKIKPSINVLNNDGVRFMLGEGNFNPFVSYKYFKYVYYFEYDIPSIFGDPLEVLGIRKIYTGKVVATQLFDQENLEKLLTSDVNTFDFHSILNLALKDEVKVSEIIGYLTSLNDDLKNDKRLSSVWFISQPNRQKGQCNNNDVNPYIYSDTIAFNISETTANEKIKRYIIKNNEEIRRNISGLKQIIDDIDGKYKSLKCYYTQPNFKKYEEDIKKIVNEYEGLENIYKSLESEITRKNPSIMISNDVEINGIDKIISKEIMRQGPVAVTEKIKRLKETYGSLVEHINDIKSKIDKENLNELSPYILDDEDEEEDLCTLDDGDEEEEIKERNRIFEASDKRKKELIENTGKVDPTLNDIINANEGMQERTTGGSNIILSNTIDFAKNNPGYPYIEDAKERSRNWYKPDDLSKNHKTLRKIFTCYWLNNNNDILSSRNEIDGLNSLGITYNPSSKTKYQIADVYPAEKVALFVLYLCFYEGRKINNGGQQYKTVIKNGRKKIAAYILFVFLFNTWCACRMYETWNTTLSNEYVYVYENQNGRKQMVEFDAKEYRIRTLMLDADTPEVLSGLLKYLNDFPNDVNNNLRPLLEQISEKEFLDGLDEGNIERIKRIVQKIERGYIDKSSKICIDKIKKHFEQPGTYERVETTDDETQTDDYEKGKYFYKRIITGKTTYYPAIRNIETGVIEYYATGGEIRRVKKIRNLIVCDDESVWNDLNTFKNVHNILINMLEEKSNFGLTLYIENFYFLLNYYKIQHFFKGIYDRENRNGEEINENQDMYTYYKTGCNFYGYNNLGDKVDVDENILEEIRGLVWNEPHEIEYLNQIKYFAYYFGVADAIDGKDYDPPQIEALQSKYTEGYGDGYTKNGYEDAIKKSNYNPPRIEALQAKYTEGYGKKYKENGYKDAIRKLDYNPPQEEFLEAYYTEGYGKGCVENGYKDASSRLDYNPPQEEFLKAYYTEGYVKKYKENGYKDASSRLGYNPPRIEFLDSYYNEGYGKKYKENGFEVAIRKLDYKPPQEEFLKAYYNEGYGEATKINGFDDVFNKSIYKPPRIEFLKDYYNEGCSEGFYKLGENDRRNGIHRVVDNIPGNFLAAYTAGYNGELILED